VGELVAGVWQRSGIERVLADGTLRRPPSVFRNWSAGHGASTGRVDCATPEAAGWVMEENPQATTKIVSRFLTK
jgi:hypothetical protein